MRVTKPESVEEPDGFEDIFLEPDPDTTPDDDGDEGNPEGDTPEDEDGDEETDAGDDSEEGGEESEGEEDEPEDEEDTPEEPGIPPKDYAARYKTPEDLRKAFNNLSAAHSRQAAELGELRKKAQPTQNQNTIANAAHASNSANLEWKQGYGGHSYAATPDGVALTRDRSGNVYTQGEDGYWYDSLGVLYCTPEQYKQYGESIKDSFIDDDTGELDETLWRQAVLEKRDEIEGFRRQKRQEVVQTREESVKEEKERILSEFKEAYSYVPDTEDTLKPFIEEAEKQFSQLPDEWRLAPGTFEGLLGVVIAGNYKTLAEVIRKSVSEAGVVASAGKKKTSGERRVNLTEKTTPKPPAKEDAATSRVRDNLGMTKEEYEKYSSKDFELEY